MRNTIEQQILTLVDKFDLSVSDLAEVYGMRLREARRQLRLAREWFDRGTERLMRAVLGEKEIPE